MATSAFASENTPKKKAIPRAHVRATAVPRVATVDPRAREHLLERFWLETYAGRTGEIALGIDTARFVVEMVKQS
ncbi:MAG: hypothetical protein WBI63_02990 [Coriobacteriia bacterium]